MTNYTDYEIRKYLTNIKESITKDVGTVLSVYSENLTGFFAIPRLLFPEIDGLGSLITGKPGATVENIISYFKLILSEIDPRYAKYAVFITFVYRHGLLHQHTPKVFEYKKKDIGWMFNMSNTNNPIDSQRSSHLNFEHDFLELNMNIFYHDVINSIDKAYEIIIKSHKDQFNRAVFEQHKPLNKTSILKNKAYKKYIKPSDFVFFKDMKLDGD
jgi:hypothetical protein